MNLAKLFEAQRELDEKIVKEKELEGQDLLPVKILALQVELGELANEWRGFKVWSNDREPRRFEKVYEPNHGLRYHVRDPLLEEFVDCLHFILSIGTEKGYEHVTVYHGTQYRDITNQFNGLFDKVGDFFSIGTKMNYIRVWEIFIGLGNMLGFTWEQIEEAFFKKLSINHERQLSGY